MIRIKIKKSLNEAGLSVDQFGLAVYPDGKFHHLMFLNMDNFRNYVEQTSPPDGEKLETLPYIHDKNKLSSNERGETPIVIGYICLEDTDSDGSCFNALQVVFSANHETYSGKGFGTHFYKVALAYANSLDRPLRPDINGPSDSAGNVWQSLDRDSRVIKNFDKSGRPTSDEASPEDEFLEDGEMEDPDVMGYFDFEEPKRTVPKIDDCKPNSKSKSKNFLNRAYASNMKTDEYNRMTNLADTFISQHFEDTVDVYDKLAQVGGKLFDRRYYR